MNRTSIKTLGFALAAALPLLASAQLTGNVSLTTNYKFRGQDQDASKVKAVKPALQGGFDYTFGDSGFYVGNWNSSVDWLSGNSLEMDFYGGYKFKAGEVDLDVGALTYAYPGNSLGNTTELYGAATYGPFTAKYWHTVSKDYFGFARPQAGHGPQGHQHRLPELRICPGSDAQGHAQGRGGLHPLCQRHQGLGRAQLHGLQRGRCVRLRQRPVAGRCRGGREQKDFFGPVNKSRVIVTLTKTL